MKESISRTISEVTQIKSAVLWVEEMLNKTVPSGAVVIGLGRLVRSIDQNSKLWAMLNDVSKQLTLTIDGTVQKGSPRDWKIMFSSMNQSEQRIASGLDGGIVFLGKSTSKMKKGEFSDLIELIYAYGSENDVVWSEKSKYDYEQYR